MMDMIDYCRDKTDKDILALPDIKERTDRYFEQDKLFREMLLENSTKHGSVVLVDLRNQEEIFSGNRFLLYSLFPDQNISIQVMWGFQRQNIVITCGYSIIDRSATVDVGSLMLKYGGGGHHRVGTCQIPEEKSDEVIQEILETLNNE